MSNNKNNNDINYVYDGENTSSEIYSYIISGFKEFVVNRLEKVIKQWENIEPHEQNRRIWDKYKNI